MNAALFIIKKSEGLAESSELASLLFTLQNEKLSDSVLLQHLAAIKSWREKMQKKTDLSEKQQSCCDGLLLLSDEVYGYISLMLTLLQFFSVTQTEPGIRAAKDNGDYHQLALAKQAMSASPFITNTILQKFRAKHALQEL